MPGAQGKTVLHLCPFLGTHGRKWLLAGFKNSQVYLVPPLLLGQTGRGVNVQREAPLGGKVKRSAKMKKNSNNMSIH